MREANIRYQVMWDRLTTIVEEQARTLIRTIDVSTREAGDVSAGVFDLQGRMLPKQLQELPAISILWHCQLVTLSRNSRSKK